MAKKKTKTEKLPEPVANCDQLEKEEALETGVLTLSQYSTWTHLR